MTSATTSSRSTTTTLSRPSRRSFLAGAAAATTAMVTLPSGTQLAFADPSDPAKGDVLVYVFLNGGADGLTLVPPVGLPSYYDLRRNDEWDITVSQGQALDIGDPTLALHPAMASVMPWWNSGDMALVHAVGSPASLSGTRSHFEAQEVWERCGLQSNTTTGWIGRHLATSSDVSGNLAGVSHSQRVWSAMQGYGNSLAINNINNFDVFGYADSTAATTVLNAIHGRTGPIESEGSDTLDAVITVSSVDFSSINPQNGADYNQSSSLANELRQVAQLIRANVGLRAVTVNLGGWDSHGEMGTPDPGQPMYERIRRLSDGLAPFLTDMGSDMNEVTVLVVSEFGRTIDVNGTGGTDHGRGGVAFAIGGNVNGGVYGGFPSVIEDGPEGDLEVMTDFRRIYAEVLDRRLDNGANATAVLNGYSTPGHLGIFN